MTGRDFGFPLAFVQGTAPALRFQIVLDALDRAERATFMADLAKTLPLNTLAGALRLFGLASGAGHQTAVAQVQDDTLELHLPLAAVEAPWRQAVVANLADFSLGNAEREFGLVRQAQLVAPGAAMEAAYTDLAQHLTQCREILTRRLPKDTWIDDYTEGQWPEEADEYRFDLHWTLATSPDPATVSGLAENLEETIAWMGFSDKGSAADWIARGDMVFPGNVTVQGSTIHWIMESPPGDPSAAILLLEDVLTRGLGIALTSFTAQIEPT